MKPTDYLALYGRRLIDAGYDIVPIAPGKKFPFLKKWESVEVTTDTLDGWLSNGHARDGVGIRTAHTPAVDIDVMDRRISTALEAWCQDNIGFAPVRIGRKPKRLLSYRTDTPFPKLSSTWVDKNGKDQKVEILGEGQQYVAWAIHPDTHEPYTWTGRSSPLTMSKDDLAPITPDDARLILAEFDRLAENAGWSPKSSTSASTAVAIPDGDELGFVKTRMDISTDDLRALLHGIPNTGLDEQPYDDWAAIGMALHHQYEGGNEGLELWREWSSQASKHDDATLDHKWAGFKTERAGKQVLTARTIMVRGKKGLKQQAATQMADFRLAFANAGTLDDLRETTSAVSTAETLDSTDREAILGMLRRAWARIEGSPLALNEARKMVRYRRKEDAEHGPNWLEGWVYFQYDDTYFHYESGTQVSSVGFDAMYDRYLISAADRVAGKTAPDVNASKFATRVCPIEVVYKAIYLPGEGPRFTFNNRPVVNAYRTHLIPEIPERYTASGRNAVMVVRGHFENMFPDKRERELFLSWLAYLVQTCRKINWSPFVQGTEGDGKSAVFELGGAVLGPDNVKTIAPQSLMHAPFNPWAEGSVLAVIEEVKLHGHNKHDVANSIKPLITNPTVEIHPKGANPFQAPNTQSYILLSNYRDALPITDDDSRYFVMNSRFQSREALAVFKSQHPGYFERLFAAIHDEPAALRKWLMEYKLHPEFDPKGRAPASFGRAQMVQMVKSDEVSTLEAVLRDTLRSDICREFLDQQSFTEEVERVSDVYVSAVAMKRFLLDKGWFGLGRVQVNGQLRVLWTMQPHRYCGEDGTVLLQKVLDRAKIVL